MQTTVTIRRSEPSPALPCSGPGVALPVPPSRRARPRRSALRIRRRLESIPRLHACAHRSSTPPLRLRGRADGARRGIIARPPHDATRRTGRAWVQSRVLSLCGADDRQRRQSPREPALSRTVPPWTVHVAAADPGSLWLILRPAASGAPTRRPRRSSDRSCFSWPRPGLWRAGFPTRSPAGTSVRPSRGWRSAARLVWS